MYKQLLRGFRRKAMPLTILAGLFLLTVSVYEAVWGAAWAGPLVYLAPGLVFCLAALELLALSFVSFEYRLVEDDFFLRARLLGKPFRACAVRLRPGQCRLCCPYRPWGRLREKKHRYYLPQVRGSRLCLLECQGEKGKICLLFRPDPALEQLLKSRLKAGQPWKAAEEVMRDRQD